MPTTGHFTSNQGTIMDDLGAHVRKRPEISSDEEVERPAKLQRLTDTVDAEGTHVLGRGLPSPPRQQPQFPVCFLTTACVTGAVVVQQALNSSATDLTTTAQELVPTVLVDFLVDRTITLIFDLLQNGILPRLRKGLVAWCCAFAIYGGSATKFVFCKLLPQSVLGPDNPVVRYSAQSLSVQHMAIGEIPRGIIGVTNT
ncbi:hypothetical protein C1H76_1678 [Elsinoe australis]|uniref:Uncharacterized protein n=1 Tax=Elsinoe australis TaxID=40998 RepID=A0A4V6YAY1_9PEZI|nr:hypothetical protein C1H76_1678 [Elsinoe australis]